MATFPTITQKYNISNWLEMHTPNAVSTASSASGCPIRNRLFTFDPLNWAYSLKLVSAADKATLETFYKANKGVPFDWDHPITAVTYEVIFAAPPTWTIASSSRLISYNVALNLTQYSPLN